MNAHLSPDEISAWLIGDESLEHAHHLAACPACSAELARLQSTLHDFREAVNNWKAPVPATSRRPRRGWRWALAAAAAVALAAVPVYRQHRADSAAREDALLLEQVDAEVSAPVADAMEPLVPLVSWNGREQKTGEMR